ncbi:hypothetical protein RFI_02416 [Reticulomyxa filosa]|uniref:Uncharacterized protein n=1 Tax=Reticulomyxa filosa TaxID=46433 RepID=X6PAK1_RETFI|nr:hypothetical protein RFI_02416 [Reticulomyxa filosa]|eukprot:ETO34672.1 hypothetical protein RFI_02416 [Reticulomyxa filosa]
MYKEAQKSGNYNASELRRAYKTLNNCWFVIFPAKVKALTDASVGGKFGSDQSMDFAMEYKEFAKYVYEYLPRNVRNLSVFRTQWQQNGVQNGTHWNWIPMLVINMPHRIATYLSNDFATIQGRVTSFASMLSYYIGFSTCRLSTPILSSLHSLRHLVMMLAFVIDIILFLLFALCVMLMHALLAIKYFFFSFPLLLFFSFADNNKNIYVYVCIRIYYMDAVWRHVCLNWGLYVCLVLIEYRL